MLASRHPGFQRRSSTSGRGSIRAFIALGWAGLVALGIACSSAESTPEAGAPGFCAATYGARCDAPCVDDECGAGLFCSLGKCTAECAGGQGCGPGLTCSQFGRCVGAAPPAPTQTAPPVPTTPPTGMPMTCPKDIKVTFTRDTPDVVFVIDQSASMRCPMNSEEPCEQAPEPPPPPEPPPLTRWDALREALLAPTGPIAQLQDQVNFGLLLYSAVPQSGQDICPDFAQVPVAPNNYEAIKTKYLVENTKNATPTGEALEQAIAQLSAPPAPGEKVNPKYVILATDGNPNDCFILGVPSAEAAQKIRKKVEDTARAGHAAGVTTLVIAVGKGLIDPTHLQSLALAGGEGKPAVTVPPAPGAEKYYEVGNEQELIATFDELTKGVRSCVIELDATVDPADAPKGKITLDGQPVAYNDPDGWKLGASNDTIEFVGKSCSKVQAASTQIAVAFQCGSKVTPKPPR